MTTLDRDALRDIYIQVARSGPTLDVITNWQTIDDLMGAVNSGQRGLALRLLVDEGDVDEPEAWYEALRAAVQGSGVDAGEAIRHGEEALKKLEGRE